MKQVRILIVGLTEGVGGVETFICNINRHIDHSKFHIDFLTHQEIDKKYIEDLTFAHGKIYTITGIKKNPLRYIKEISKFFKYNKYDIVHLNECGASHFIYAFPLMFDKKTKLIIHSHNGSSKQKVAHYFFSKLQDKRANERWACSKIAAEWMFGTKKYDNNTVRIIHNGIDLNLYAFNEDRRKKIRDELAIDESDIVIGSIARFEPQKNHKKIISVFSRFHSIHYNSVLVLVGDGVMRSEIEEIVKAEGLEGRVYFLGIRNDIPELLSGFDVFLLPSLYEGLPFVSIEAQAASLPLVVSDTVSSEIDLTPLVKRVNLDAADDEWCIEIEKALISDDSRKQTVFIEMLKKAGYDIGSTCRQIENIYTELASKN